MKSMTSVLQQRAGCLWWRHDSIVLSQAQIVPNQSVKASYATALEEYIINLSYSGENDTTRFLYCPSFNSDTTSEDCANLERIILLQILSGVCKWIWNAIYVCDQSWENSFNLQKIYLFHVFHDKYLYIIEVFHDT